jgi:uncharacterized delta-60 repeat protein
VFDRCSRSFALTLRNYFRLRFFATALMLICVTVPAANAAGEVESAFGQDGHVLFATTFGGVDIGRVIELADGRLLIAGYCNQRTPTETIPCLFRLSRSGIVDPQSFTSLGALVTGVGYVLSNRKNGWWLQAPCAGLAGPTCLIEIDENGSLNLAFGQGGRLVLANGPAITDGGLFHWATTYDGKILVAGTCKDERSAQSGLCVRRYLQDGSLDATLRGGGQFSDPVSIDTFVNAVFPLPSGKFVLAGTCFENVVPNAGNGFCLTRYTENGNRDTTYGSSGSVAIVIPNAYVTSSASSQVIQSDESIVLGINCDGPQPLSFCLARVTADGRSDIAFGSGGVTSVRVGAGDTRDLSIAAQSDGKLLLGGACGVSVESKFQFCLVRYTPQGQLDSAFAGRGYRTYEIASNRVLGGGMFVPLTYGSSGRIFLAALCNADTVNSDDTGYGCLLAVRTQSIERAVPTLPLNGLLVLVVIIFWIAKFSFCSVEPRRC